MLLIRLCNAASIADLNSCIQMTAWLAQWVHLTVTRQLVL